jgi:glucosamine--fructose-6-phosphate aminotransferase (isomerizing)
VGSQEAAPLLLEGLRQLEYRGYDSAGIATVNAERQLTCLRAEGKLVNLTQRFKLQGLPATAASVTSAGRRTANRRSATPTPHLDGKGEVAVVQNGIIENYRSLREERQADGVVFRSDTDTEVIPHLACRQRRWCGPRRRGRWWWPARRRR